MTELKLAFERERTEVWAWPKGMEDKEYGPFVDGVTRGREPHSGGAWHGRLTVRAVLAGVTIGEETYTWVERADGEPDNPGRFDNVWRQLEARLRAKAGQLHAEGIVA